MTSGYGSHDVHQDHESYTEGERPAETPTKRAESSEAYENQEEGSQALTAFEFVSSTIVDTNCGL